jgi:hypothetical protein
MQTASPSSPRPRQPKQILLIGLPGCGKTGFTLTFPNPAIIDADLNVDGAERRLRITNKDLEYKYAALAFDEKGVVIPEDERFVRMLRECESAKTDPWVKTIIFDSLTMLHQYLIWQIQAANKTDSMAIKEWGKHRGSMLSLLAKQRATGKTTIMICHRQEKTRKKKDNKGNDTLEEEVLGYLPSINPGLQEDIGGMFTDIYHVTMKLKAGDQYENWIETMPTTMMPYLKNSIGLPPRLDVTKGFSALQPYWKD